MNTDHHTCSWLLESQLAPFVDAFMLHLFDCRYAFNTINNYLAGLTHFAHWLTENSIDVKRIDEALIQRFLDEHLPNCRCAKPAFSNAQDLHAALGHLLALLRTHAIIADPSQAPTPVDEELQRFDDYMNHVRGLATRTRKHYLAIIRSLLLEQFAGRSVVIAAIKPDQIRQFIASQSARCTVSASIGMPVSALRCYFRYPRYSGRCNTSFDRCHQLPGQLATSHSAKDTHQQRSRTLVRCAEA